MKRQVRRLKWVRELAAKPGCIPQGRPRGAKAFGTRYEKALAKQLCPVAKHGRWFEFEDAEGRGFCQTDFLLHSISANALVVLECKYTWTEDARVELEKLYVPVVAMANPNLPVTGIVVCQKLTVGIKERVTDSLAEAILYATSGRRVVWQWLPKTPIFSVGPSFGALPPDHQVRV